MVMLMDGTACGLSMELKTVEWNSNLLIFKKSQVEILPPIDSGTESGPCTVHRYAGLSQDRAQYIGTQD